MCICLVFLSMNVLHTCVHVCSMCRGLCVHMGVLHVFGHVVCVYSMCAHEHTVWLYVCIHVCAGGTCVRMSVCFREEGHP